MSPPTRRFLGAALKRGATAGAALEAFFVPLDDIVIIQLERLGM
jgi:hypothetical protein